MEEIDPYATPAMSVDEVTSDAAILREIVTGWEKLRVLYNLILLVPGIVILTLWTMMGGMPLAMAIVSALGVALGANASFFLGPLVELYFRAIFRKGKSIGKGRWLIVGAGLVVTAGVLLLAAFEGIITAYFPEPM